MGEFTNGETPTDQAAQDRAVTGEPGTIKTDVEGVFADGEKDGMPVFNVSKNCFYQNMAHGRKRLRFKNGSTAQQYMSKTRYNRSFWIQHGDLVRKVK